MLSSTSWTAFPNSTTYEWSTGDGATVNGQTVTYIYSGAGNYLVCLYALVEGCVDTVCQVVNIGNESPCSEAQVAFTWASSGNAIVQFDAYSSPQAIGYLWEFGDGTVGNGENPVHSYQEQGSYEVCLSAWTWNQQTQDTCWAEECLLVVASGTEEPCDALQADLIAYVLMGGVQFSNTTTGTGFQTTWSWAFGDGAGSNDAQSFHVYPGPGNYLVCLTAISIYEQQGGGLITCVDSVCQEITVPVEGTPCDSLTAEFTAWPSGLGVNFQNAVIEPSWSYHWYFDDGSEGAGPNPFHLYPDTGWYVVCLVVGTYDPLAEDSCFAEYCTGIQLGGGGSPCDSLSADFWWQQGGGPTNIFFSATSGNASHWLWTFGDGSSSDDGPQGTHEYTEPGTYQLCLTAWYPIQGTQDTCSATSCQWVTFGGSPCDGLEAGFQANVGDVTVWFSNTTIGTGFQTTWLWDFGDGTTSNDAQPSHIFPGLDTYEVCLTVTSIFEQPGGGIITCQDSYCQSVVTGGTTPCDNLWTASFEFGNQGNVYTFFNTSNTEGAVVSTQWAFGDGTFGDGSQLIHTYTTSGNYTICMTITGIAPGTNDTCQVELCQNIEISVGIEDVIGSLPINVWPQPFDDAVRLEGEDLRGNTRYTLMDMTGRIMNDRLVLSQDRITLDYSGLTAGTYLLRLRNGHVDRSLRVMKH